MEHKTENQRLQALLKKYADDSDYIGRLNIRVGNNDHERTVEEAAKLGRRVLFLTGNRAMRNYGFLQKYMGLFKRHGLDARLFDNISSNPTLKQMEEGLEAAVEHRPDFIFALGGGSVIDTAKIIGVGVKGNIWDFVENRAEIREAIPIVASATTSGTGSHVSCYAVVTNTDTSEKKTLKSPLLLPKISAVDLDITRHMPSYVQATTGFDVLCHAAEVYTRKDCTPMAADFCENALSMVREHLVAAYNNDSIDSKHGMAYADIYAGIALTLIGTHVPHAISHPISARFPYINHGQALAYVFAETIKKQIENGDEEIREKFTRVSGLLGGSSDLARTARNYVKLLDLQGRHDFSAEDRELVYLDTIGYRKSSLERSPAGLTQTEVREIIENSIGQPKH